jgi:hypothetical protein
MHVAILAGDGVGPEVVAEARRVLEALHLPQMQFEDGLVGGAAYKASGHPLPEETLQLARRADAILFGAVGDPDCDNLERHLRPEQAILGLRSALKLFANLRPAKLFPELADASALRPEIAKEIDQVGGEFNAFTAREHTCFHLLLLGRDYDLGVDILVDILLNSTFKPDEFERERRVILQEISMVEESPEELAYDIYFEKIYGTHGLGKPILGTEKSVKNFFRRFAQKNVYIEVLCVCGPF